jgi:hypothetical protein
LNPVGLIGLMRYDLSAGNYENRGWELTTDIGGLVSSVSGVGVGVAKLSGDENMEKNFGYGLILGSALGMAGSAGQMTEALIRGDFKDSFGESMMAVGGITASVSGLGATVASAAGQTDLANSLGMVSLVGGGISTVGAVSILGGSVADWMKSQGEKNQGRKDAREWISENSSDPSALTARLKTGVDISEAGFGLSSGEQTPLSPSYEQGFRAEIGKELKANHPEVYQSLSPERASVSKGNSSSEKEVRDTQWYNDKAQEIATYNGIISGVLNTALSVQPDLKTLFSNDSIDRGATTIAKVSEQYAQLGSNPPAQLALNDAQVRVFEENQRMSQSALKHLEQSIALGQTPDREIIAMGRRAAEANERMVKRVPELRVANTDDFTPLIDWSPLVAAERATRLNFRAEVEVLSLMLQAERELVGKRIVASNAEQRQIERLGSAHQRKMRAYRESISEIDPILESRLKVAERAWAKPEFIRPQDALRHIERSVNQIEDRYQKMKTALVSVARR